jgi:hypothetical protein
MAVFNGAFPVLPGKADEVRAFAREVSGPKKAGYDAQQRREGITRETWSLQELPDGSALVLVWFEAADIEAAFADLAAANDEYAKWFRGRVKEITGVDLTEPAEGGPELVLEWEG